LSKSNILSTKSNTGLWPYGLTGTTLTWSKTFSNNLFKKSKYSKTFSPPKRALKAAFVSPFGSIFRCDLTNTHFARQMERYAELYTSSLQNLTKICLKRTFFPPRVTLRCDHNLLHETNKSYKQKWAKNDKNDETKKFFKNQWPLWLMFESFNLLRFLENEFFFYHHKLHKLFVKLFDSPFLKYLVIQEIANVCYDPVFKRTATSL